MAKQCLSWLPVNSKSIRNKDYQSSFPELVATYYRGTLFDRILGMQKKEVISFEDAIRLVERKSTEASYAGDAKKSDWYYRNFIEYVSELGFHIELSGDEFVFHLSAREL